MAPDGPRLMDGSGARAGPEPAVSAGRVDILTAADADLTMLE
jgi:hypothetical protein